MIIAAPIGKVLVEMQRKLRVDLMLFVTQLLRIEISYRLGTQSEMHLTMFLST